MADNTTARLEALADEMQIALAELLELCDRHGLELVAKQARPTGEHPGGHL